MDKTNQLKILQLLSHGATAREIAEKMEYSPRSIEKEIEFLKRFYEVENVVHLVAVAMRKKLIK